MTTRISSCCSASLIYDEREDETAMCAECKEWCAVVSPEDTEEDK